MGPFPAPALHTLANRTLVVTVSCGGKRRPLLRLKRIPANQRQKQKYQDVPKRFAVELNAPGTDGRLTSEINNANGPQQLQGIIVAYGEALSPIQLSMMLARLAAMKLANTKLTTAQKVVLLQCASKCIAALQQNSLAGCDHSSLARISVSLARLAAPNLQLLQELIEQSAQQLHLFKPDTAVALLAGLTACNHRPPADWLDHYCLEAYIRMTKYNANELASMIYCFACLGHQPSAAWLEAVCKCFRTTSTLSSTPAALTKFLFAAIKLQACIERNWLLSFLTQASAKMDAFSSTELSTFIWCLAQLGHKPDPVLLDAFNRAAVKRMHTASAASVALLLQSMCVLGMVQLPAKLLTALYPQVLSVLPVASPAELACMLKSLVLLRMRPDEDFFDAFITASEACMARFSRAQLLDVLWSLARVHYLPDAAWLSAYKAALRAHTQGRGGAAAHGLSEGDEEVLAWACRQLGGLRL